MEELNNTVSDFSTVSATEQSNPIEVTEKGNFIIPTGYNPIIAREGDINSKTITFRLPQSYGQYSLKTCDYKRIKWKNMKSLIEDTSQLTVIENETSTTFDVQWAAPPEAFTAAGELKISISIFSIQSGQISFQWNSSEYSGFSVGEAFSEVGENNIASLYVPAANEILSINEESRQIVAPAGYNNVFCTYGDKNTSVIYFRVKSKIKDIDLTAESTVIEINVGFADVVTKYSNKDDDSCLSVATKILSSGTGLVDLVWLVPPEITFNDRQYDGNLTISLTFTQNEKKWGTKVYDKLLIGESFFVGEENPSEMAVEWIQSVVLDYLNSLEFIFDSNDTE